MVCDVIFNKLHWPKKERTKSNIEPGQPREKWISKLSQAFTKAAKAIASTPPIHCLGALARTHTNYNFFNGCPLPRRKCLGDLIMF